MVDCMFGNIFAVFVVQSHLLELLQRLALLLLIDGQEGGAGGRRGPPDLLMENINKCLKRKILELVVCVFHPKSIFICIHN